MRMNGEPEARAALHRKLLLISLDGICLPRLLQFHERRLHSDGARGGAKIEEAQNGSDAIFRGLPWIEQKVGIIDLRRLACFPSRARGVSSALSATVSSST